MIRLILPGHLRALANAGSEVELHIAGQATQRSVLDALEAQYPVLRGMTRDHVGNGAVHSCGFSPARKIFHMKSQMRHCPIRSPRERSPFWS
jgi:hypothetical protein